MEFNVASPRVDHAAQSNTPLLRAAAKPVAVRPETANPVTAAEPVSLPALIKGLGIRPLDVFQVGDNDDIPLPPEPPRRSSMQAIMPQVVEAPAHPTVENLVDEPVDEITPAPRAGRPATLPNLLKDLTDPTPNPTVDIRR